MEELTLGEMGMSVDQLYNILPRSLINKINGFRKVQRDDWERDRIQTFLLMSVNFQKGATITPQEIMPLPWDGEIKNNAKIDAKRVREEAAKRWAEIDALQNNTA